MEFTALGSDGSNGRLDILGQDKRSRRPNLLPCIVVNSVVVYTSVLKI